jgi:hypothetical protein
MEEYAALLGHCHGKPVVLANNETVTVTVTVPATTTVEEMIQ